MPNHTARLEFVKRTYPGLLLTFIDSIKKQGVGRNPPPRGHHIMGRPWWYDSYWQKETKQPDRWFRRPGRQWWVWGAVMVLSLLLAVNRTGFQIVLMTWFLGFIYYLCRILIYIILIRVLLSWFPVSRRNVFVSLLDDVTEPILAPLRRVVPRLGMFDITPLIAIAILYLIPFLLNRLVTF